MTAEARGARFAVPFKQGRLVSKPGVTQELRTRAAAHVAAESRQRRVVAVAVALAVVAVCVYVVLRWLA